MFRNQETDLLPIGMFLSVSNCQGIWIVLTHSLPKTRKAAGTVTVLTRSSKVCSYQKLQYIRQNFIATKWVREAFLYTFVGNIFSCYAMRKLHTKRKEKKDISLHVKCLLFLPKLKNFTQVLVQPSNTKLLKSVQHLLDHYIVDSQYRWTLQITCIEPFFAR